MARRRHWAIYAPPGVAAGLIAAQVVLWSSGNQLPWIQVALFVATLLILAFAFVDMLIRDLNRKHLNPITERTAILGVMVVESVLFFAVTYLAISEYPDEIVGMKTPLDAVYFAMTTLLTIGFGDIAAQGQIARGAVLIQMIFTVVLLSATVRLFTSLTKSIAQEHARAHASGHRHED